MLFARPCFVSSYVHVVVVDITFSSVNSVVELQFSHVNPTMLCVTLANIQYCIHCGVSMDTINPCMYRVEDCLSEPVLTALPEHAMECLYCVCVCVAMLPVCMLLCLLLLFVIAVDQGEAMTSIRGGEWAGSGIPLVLPLLLRAGEDEVARHLLAAMRRRTHRQ